MSTATPDIENLLAGHRPWLMRQARWRLGAEASAADDVVQETLIAAWSGLGSLRGEPTRGWLAGILRNKVADHWRRVPPTDPPEAMVCGSEDFDESGHWAFKVAEWGDPEKILEAEGFWGILDLCSKIMPVAMYRVFSLREIDGLSVAEICAALDLSPSNCHVLLHRARIRLRGCIGSKWGRS